MTTVTITCHWAFVHRVTAVLRRSAGRQSFTWAIGFIASRKSPAALEGYKLTVLIHDKSGVKKFLLCEDLPVMPVCR